MSLREIKPVVKTKPSVLLVLHNSDISYVNAFGRTLNKHFSGVGYHTGRIQLKTELAIEAKKRKTRFIATTSLAVMKVVDPFLEGSLNDNIGTVLEFDGLNGETLRLVLLPVLKTMFVVNHGHFLIDHFCGKLKNGGILRKDRFDWKFVTPQNLEETWNGIDSSKICAVDIETSRDGLRITSCSYTWLNPDLATTTTRVVRCKPEDYPFCITAIRRLNATASPKVMQNGKYDSSYFMRFDMPLNNWIYDTYHMNHAIFAELPRDLAFVSSFYLDNFRFWKDEAGRNLYEYNGKDTHNTLWTFLAQMLFVQDAEYQYAIKNYLLLFPVIFPALSCAMDGMEVDEEIRLDLLAKEEIQKETARLRINNLIGEEHFNPSSPKQVKELMAAFGWKDNKSTDAKTLKKWKEKDSVFGHRLVTCILDYRHSVKAIGTYFQVSLLNGRLMYSLDPSGTETGRMASRESAFWCGTQIQNIPPYARAMVKAEDGWMFGAVDKAQSESYCTGYISRDLNLIRAVTTSPDFHCQNASMFFGIPFEELYDADYIDPDTGERGKVLNKAIRKLGKPVNHGANYNMGPDVLLDTMGESEVIKAKNLLKLPADMQLRSVCEYLLLCFDKTYPRIRGEWYKEIVLEVLRTGKLTLPSVGYVRRTFLRPNKNKLDLNACVAHKPQSLSVHLVNKAFKKVWYELQIKKYSGKFRLKAQVHDEILFIAKPDLLDSVCHEVADIMVIPTKVEGRTMTIPSTIAKGKYWSEAK